MSSPVSNKQPVKVTGRHACRAANRHTAWVVVTLSATARGPTPAEPGGTWTKTPAESSRPSYPCQRSLWGEGGGQAPPFIPGVREDSQQKSPRDSPLSSTPSKEHLRCLHAISCFLIITCLTGPLLYHPSDGGHCGPTRPSISVCTKTLFEVPSQEPGFPVPQSLALYFPLPPASRPSPHTWSSKAEANLTANKTV